MNQDTFYKQLPSFDSFFDVGDLTRYTRAPDDWYILITDVRGSTKAIEEGRCKEVIGVGAASVVAVLNTARDIEIPFVFGGDGASLLIPPTLLDRAQKALRGAQEVAQKAFNLDLRVGIVPVADVRAAGTDVLVAKLRLSHSFNQALFAGGGLSHAEKCIKDPATTDRYLVPAHIEAEADFAGLSCRWNDIQSIHGETIALLVKATMLGDPACDKLYRRVIAEIEKAYGDETVHHPVPFESLSIAWKNKVLMVEAKLHAARNGAIHYWSSLLKAKLHGILFTLARMFNISLGDANLARYRKHLIATVDYKKFDDALRLVISGTTSAREQLTAFLEKERQLGRLVYGIHVSNRALMTCLVFEKYGQQVHFVDAADGGYTFAAKQLKKQSQEKF